MNAMVTIQFIPGIDYKKGDYAILCGNAGEGDIDFDIPLSEEIPLFPNGCGIFGFGHQPFGKSRFCRPFSNGPLGWLHLPFCKGPFALGSALIEAKVQVESCGNYKYAFKVFDSTGNENEGAPEEVELAIHIAPPAPDTALKKYSYDKDTDVLILTT